MTQQPPHPTAVPEPAPSPADAASAPADAGPRQGWTPPIDDPHARAAALDHALDYRGDVTLELTDGRVVTGYIFDRREQAGRRVARMLLAEPAEDGNERLNVPYEQIARLVFSGRDPAAGKSWENWIRRYAEKKLAGEKAEITSEPLE